MNLDKEIEEIERHVKALQAVLASLTDRLARAKKAWPSHQILPAEWRDRSETPPAGQIWASDGINVWLIRKDGGPIDPGATAVKYWTTAYIPAPPYGKNAT
jgi:hypothetical protein